MTAPRVIHHSVYAFPLDRHFYGQTYVVMNHLLNTGLPTSVVSKEGPDEDNLNQRLVETHTGSSVLFDNYRAAIAAQRAPERLEREIGTSRKGIREVERQMASLDRLLAGVPTHRHATFEPQREQLRAALAQAHVAVGERETA